MGLDMFLNRRIYIGANYESNNITGKIELERNGVPININLKKVTYINEQVIYWRNAYEILKWFVDNVQNGEEDCREYYVDPVYLKEFIDLCKTTVKQLKDGNVSHENLALPSEEEVKDDFYINELIRTIKVIEPLLGEDDFYFDSNW
jgi:hypothetical protein